MRLLQSFLRTTVWLGDDIVAQMRREAGRAAKLEVGGVLMGYVNGRHVVVTDVIGPGPRAELREDEFCPDSDWQAQEIARVYKESGRHTTYLGDWHTHPTTSPAPSLKDSITARKIAETSESRVPHPVMLILGRRDGRLSLAAYRYVRGRLRLRRLKVYESPETS